METNSKEAQKWYEEKITLQKKSKKNSKKGTRSLLINTVPRFKFVDSFKKFIDLMQLISHNITLFHADSQKIKFSQLKNGFKKI